MKLIRMLPVLATAGLAAGDPPPIANSLHRQQSFVLHLNGSVSAVTPLFGPVHEAKWSPAWTPRFVYPAVADQIEGAVFTTNSHSGRECIWVMTVYDDKQGRVEYVVATPGVTASQISVRILPEGKDNCRATVTYRHTALGAEGNAEVEKLDAAWAEQQRRHWEVAINQALARESRNDGR